VTPGAGTYVYPIGTVVNITAIPDPLGYKFGSWQGDINSIGQVNAASTVITMDRDRTIYAKFNNVQVRRLTVLCAGNGTVTQPGVGTFEYNQGTVVALRAVPGSGGSFITWIAGGQIANALSATTTITVSSDDTITATFIP
jgi:hypothetical protein